MSEAMWRLTGCAFACYSAASLACCGLDYSPVTTYHGICPRASFFPYFTLATLLNPVRTASSRLTKSGRIDDPASRRSRQSQESKSIQQEGSSTFCICRNSVVGVTRIPSSGVSLAPAFPHVVKLIANGETCKRWVIRAEQTVQESLGDIQ